MRFQLIPMGVGVSEYKRMIGAGLYHGYTNDASTHYIPVRQVVLVVGLWLGGIRIVLLEEN